MKAFVQPLEEVVRWFWSWKESYGKFPGIRRDMRMSGFSEGAYDGHLSGTCGLHSRHRGK